MKTKGTGREKWKRIAGGLAAGVLLLSLLIPGSLAEEKTEEDPDEFSAEYVLALDAVERLGITDGDGNPIEIRTDKVPRGRGYGSTETEPDYTGVIGYAVLSNDPDFCLAPVMASYRWMIPVYEDVDGKTGGQYGRISHKTPRLAVGQTLKQVRNRRYRGYVRVIRLDRQELCWINVNHFETVTYWNLKLSSACRYGYCLAVYREDGTLVYGTNTLIDTAEPVRLNESGTIDLKIEALPAANGEYSIDLALHRPDGFNYDFWRNICRIRVMDKTQVPGELAVKHKWVVK